MRKLPKAITEEQYKKLLKVASKEWNEELRYRNLTILILLYEAGLRASDLTHLKMQHIDLYSKQMMILNSKRGKDRIVPITQNIEYAIKEYLKHRKSTSEYLIPGRTEKPMDRTTLNYLIEKLSAKAKVTLIDGTYPSPHSLRHGFATQSLKTGLYNLEELRRILGHESIATTSIYTYVVIDDLVEKAQQKPVDKKIAALFK